jgi:hypothetical protein
MATSNPTDPDASRRFQTNYEVDDQLQGAVLGHVLTLHPANTLSKAELIRELIDVSVDAAERAIRDLVGAGLFHPLEGRSELVRPTRAALRFCELQEGV